MLRLGLILCAALCAGLLRVSPSGAQVGFDYPRVANMYWNVETDTTTTEALAQWDVVVLNTDWALDDLDHLRSLNPNLKLYQIINIYALNFPSATNDPFKLGLYNYAQQNDLWWYNTSQQISSDWPGSGMVNITPFGATGPQGAWLDFVADQVEQFVAARPQLDGIFFDNFWERISWQQVWRQLDSDCNPTHNPAGCDSVADDNASLDALWSTALAGFATEMRQRFDVLQQSRANPLTIITNGSSSYYENLNGTMLEFFPSGHGNLDYDNAFGYNWYEEMFACNSGYMRTPFLDTPYNVHVLNGDYPGTKWFPARNPAYERLKRFVLGSALLGDGFMSLDEGDDGHGNLWWEGEYDHDGRGKGYLGQPTGSVVRLLQPTGAERITNPDFQSAAGGWVSFPFGATGSFAYDTSEFVSAPSSARIDVSSIDTQGGHYKMWQTPFTLTHHDEYTISFWARSSDFHKLRVHFYSNDCPNLRCWQDFTFCVTDQWERHEISFASNGTTTAAGLNFFVEQPGSVWIDDVSFRDGNTGLFRRDFDNGFVVLNYTNVDQAVAFADTVYRIDVAFSDKHDGAPVLQDIIKPSDALIYVLTEPGPNGPPIDPPSDVPAPSHAAWLAQNQPNPFNPSTRIAFRTGAAGRTRLEIYDVSGRWVRTLLDQPLASNSDRIVVWDGRNQVGAAVASGVYFYRLRAPGFTRTRQMVLVR